MLTAMDGNTSSATPCFYLTIIYAVGVFNHFGPKDPRTVNCIMGLPLSSASPTSHDSHSAVVFAGVFGALAIIFIYFSIDLFTWQARIKKKRSNSAISERSSRSYPRPNTGSIWFDIKE
ncbi:hypothetical protein Cni_G14525 [Canna indica]|uniref:Uncharacterized protein n=1 Tax=Canna indica TaxID=4628 RepID=A0AAQ3KD24_9LILI|nr:hypothetical protein Cni_G14525 [Canna indica]